MRRTRTRKRTCGRVLEAHGARFEDLSEQQRTEVLNALNAMSAIRKRSASPSPTCRKGSKKAREASE